jgi:hypothetical protein
LSAQPEDPVIEPEPTPEPELEPEPEPTAPEPEPEPEQPAPPAEAAQTEKEIKKRQDALSREAERHAGRVNEILGEDALGLIPCEACPPTVAGWHYPADAYPEGDPSRLLYEMLAGGSEAVLRHPARYKECPDCGGFGRVLTGSKEAQFVTKVCPNVDCKGTGYVDTDARSAPVIQLTSPADAEQPGEQQPTPDVDFLGRPVGHPNYGKMTSYMTPDELAIDQRDGFGLG